MHKCKFTFIFFSIFCGLVCESIVHESLPADEPRFVFRDVCRESGLLKNIKGIKGHGAAWGDVDGDGWPDLYIATFHYEGTRPNQLFRNRQGKFQLDQNQPLQISTRATGVLFADLDNDGDLDLYVGSMPANSDSRLAKRLGYPLRGCSLFRNDGKGNFTDVSSESGACPPDFGGRSATTLDLDGDGLLDLLVGEDPIAGYNGSHTTRSRLFRNRGRLRFEDITDQAGIPPKAAGLGVATADLNGDGKTDFILASTLGIHLMLNEGHGKFSELASARETFAWPKAKGDDMICGVAISDVNGDSLPDIVIGQHFSAPWTEPVANRLYLHRGNQAGKPRFEDVTESAGLVPLPLKGPHVEIQDFDNDGKPDIYTSIVKFAQQQPHPVIFRNLGNNQQGIPRFKQTALAVNDFPTPADRQTKRSKTFFEKMIADRKITYAAPGPTGDFDRDGRLDICLPSWWGETPTLLLRNESPSGHWLEISVVAGSGTNRMGVGSQVTLYAAGHAGEKNHRLGSREIATGFGYASAQEAVAHFGLGQHKKCDVVVVLPYGQGKMVKQNILADQRIQIKQP